MDSATNIQIRFSGAIYGRELHEDIKSLMRYRIIYGAYAYFYKMAWHLRYDKTSCRCRSPKNFPNWEAIDVPINWSKIDRDNSVKRAIIAKHRHLHPSTNSDPWQLAYIEVLQKILEARDQETITTAMNAAALSAECEIWRQYWLCEKDVDLADRVIPEAEPGDRCFAVEEPDQDCEHEVTQLLAAKIGLD
jgi:hypothetical protein